MVITGEAGAQIMGDWAQGEFALAGQVAGEDYSCLPGLGLTAILDAGGDAFYFPVQDDAEVTAAQKELAALLLSPEVQVVVQLGQGLAADPRRRRPRHGQRVHHARASSCWPPATSCPPAPRCCPRTPTSRSTT